MHKGGVGIILGRQTGSLWKHNWCSHHIKWNLRVETDFQCEIMTSWTASNSVRHQRASLQKEVSGEEAERWREAQTRSPAERRDLSGRVQSRNRDNSSQRNWSAGRERRQPRFCNSTVTITTPSTFTSTQFYSCSSQGSTLAPHRKPGLHIL